MLKNKKVVIFDMDGTLIDSIGIWNAIDEELIKTIGDGRIDNAVAVTGIPYSSSGHRWPSEAVSGGCLR